MAGYDKYSMSKNARDAYSDGERPKSKWTKSDILSEIEKQTKEDGKSVDMKDLQKVSAETLKDNFLYKTSWHHTSSKYNKTDFYSVNSKRVDDIYDPRGISELYKIDERNKANKKTKMEEPEEMWECEYLTWSGTRKHPKATTNKEVGVIRGNWFYLPDGSKKKVDARGFSKIKKVPNKKRSLNPFKKK